MGLLLNLTSGDCRFLLQVEFGPSDIWENQADSPYLPVELAFPDGWSWHPSGKPLLREKPAWRLFLHQFLVPSSPSEGFLRAPE